MDSPSHTSPTSTGVEDHASLAPQTQEETAVSTPVKEVPSEADIQEPAIEPSTTAGDAKEPVDNEKVDVLLKAVGDAPIMKKKRWAVGKTKKVIWVADFVRKCIKCEPNESLFLYVNQCFSPCPDQEIGSLYECFGSDGKLVLHYCKQQAWG